MPDIHAPVSLPEGTPVNRGFGGAVFFFLFAVLAVMACLKYLALHSTVFDLGVFLSNLYSLHTDNQWWRAFLGHAQPLLPVYAQVYRLVPDQAAPLVLLTAQAFVLALPALWAGRRYGLLAALCYALYFPVWTNALFDFHFDHLLIPMLFAFLLAATSGRTLLAFVLGLLPALVKEPYALTTVCCGAYLLLFQGRKRAGWALMVLGGLYFYAVTTYVVPFCTADGGLGAQSGAYAWLGGGPGAALATMFGHPFTVLAQVLGVPGKWKYLLLLFGALLFFPLFRPKLLLPALPALALALLSAHPNYYGWANHYTAGAAGALFFAFCEVLGPVRILARQSGIGARQFGLALFGVLGLVHVALAPSPVSRLFWTTDNFAFSIEAYEPTARDAAILAEMLKSVPRDPSLAVVSQNTLNWGALAERLNYNSFPLGVFAPHPVRDLSKASLADFWAFVRTGKTPDLPVRAWQAQYVILDLTRPWFVLDKGCEFTGGLCRDEDVAREFNALVIRARQELETVYDQGGFLILRRPQPVAPAPQPAAPAAPAIGDGVSPPAQGGQTPPATGGAAPQGSPAGSVPAGAPAPSGQTPASPSGIPTPGAPAASSQPAMPGAPAVQAPAPAAGAGEVEVEVLDRFPTHPQGKKAKPVPTVAPEAPPAPAVGSAPGPDAVVPEGQPAPPKRRSKRHEAPASTPGTDAAPAPEAATSPAPQSDIPAQESAPKKERRARRQATPAPSDTLAAPENGALTAPGTDATATPDVAPAVPKKERHSRRRPAPTEAAPAPDGAGVAAPQGDGASAQDAAPAQDVAPKKERRIRRPRQATEIPAPAPAEGGDRAPAP